MTENLTETTARQAFNALQNGRCVEIHHQDKPPFNTGVRMTQYKLIPTPSGVPKLMYRVYSYHNGVKMWGKWLEDKYEYGLKADAWIDGTESALQNKYFICKECTLSFTEAIQEVSRTSKNSTGFIISENGTIVDVWVMSSGLVRLNNDPERESKYPEFHLEYMDIDAKWRVM